MGTKISALTALGAAPAVGDRFPVVDVSDTTDAASGTSKYVTQAFVSDAVVAAINAGGTAFTLYGSTTVGGTVAVAGLSAGKLVTSDASGDLLFVNNPVIAQINDANGNEALKLGAIASAVNELLISNSATGLPVTLAPTGGDTNISAKLSGKGTGFFYGNREVFIVPLSDLTTALTTGTNKGYLRLPYAVTVLGVFAYVVTAPTGGTLLTIDINDSGTTILSTKLTFDASEKSTDIAATPAVISDSAIAAYAEITFDIDAVGSTIAGAGLAVGLIVVAS